MQINSIAMIAPHFASRDINPVVRKLGHNIAQNADSVLTLKFKTHRALTAHNKRRYLATVHRQPLLLFHTPQYYFRANLGDIRMRQ